VSWYRKAIATGEPTAMYNLGLMYTTGGGGLRRDPAEARHWISRAADGGLEQAKQWLQETPR
jgi:TPR repeat protein